MQPLVARATLSLLTIAAAIGPTLAWAPETRIRILDEAIRLMPASLRLALEHHREPVLRGLLEPQLHEEDAAHRPPWSGGSLDEEVERRAHALVESVQEARRFREIARNFGALAHFVMDAGFPPGMSPDGAPRYGHFAAFCESRREKFPLVFYGHEDPQFVSRDYRGFTVGVMERARSEDLDLARAYRLAGQPPDPFAFDDRSVPFAVASLSYSRTVTDVVRVWLAAWAEADGDLGRTPYREPR